MRRLRLLRFWLRQPRILGDMLVMAGTALHFADENRGMFEDYIAAGRVLNEQDRENLRSLAVMAHALVTPRCPGFGEECSK